MSCNKLSGNKPVLAVIENNGYRLGDVNIAKILDDVHGVVGFTAVKTAGCKLDTGLSNDGLHLNGKGYQLWAT